MTTEQDLSENHIRVLLHRLHNAVDKKSWEEVVELASELELVASKQARDQESFLAAARENGVVLSIEEGFTERGGKR